MNLDLEYTGSGNGKRYTIASKIKVCEVIASGAIMTHLSRELGVSTHALTKWYGDYKRNMYTLDNTTQIVRKPKTSLQIILEQAEKAANEAVSKVQRIKDAIATLEAEGVKVA